MGSAHFTINPSGIERCINGPESRVYRTKQGRRIAQAWKANIHRVTGATDRSIEVEQDGKQTIVAADTRRDPNSAWPYLEYGTSRMRAQAPGRRAIRR